MRHECDEREPVLDHCGIVAIHSHSADIPMFQEGLVALQTIQTRGQDGAGVGGLTFTGETFEYKGEGTLDDVFPSSAQRELFLHKAQTWIFQVRYGTNGAFCPDNVQPFVAKHLYTGERFIVAHNGQFSDDATDDGDGKLSDTYRFTKALAAHRGFTWKNRIGSVLENQRGAWSLAIATPEGMFLARDPHGFRPLVYGMLWHHDTRQMLVVAASETAALEQIGVRDFTEVMPGQLLRVTDTVRAVSSFCNGTRPSPCIFETVYVHDGASKAHLPRKNSWEINGSPTIDELRQRCGRILAREAPLTTDDVDFIVGVPGTGIAGGRAFAEALGLPYEQVIRDRDPQQNPRTFLTADITSIYELALKHFAFDESRLRGRRVGVVDDSIVRGNILRAVVALLRDYGAVAVHCRSLSPVIDKGCHLGINTRSRDELIAGRFDRDVEKIRRAIGADSLAYLHSRGLREALVGNPDEERFCMGCMAGHFPPIDRNGKVIYERE